MYFRNKTKKYKLAEKFITKKILYIIQDNQEAVSNLLIVNARRKWKSPKSKTNLTNYEFLEQNGPRRHFLSNFKWA